MSEPFIGEIKMFAGNFAPRGWALCDGQLLAVSQNDALFSLIGTVYGGDGRTTFGLPELRGRLPVHAGTGPGLPEWRLGSNPGQENVSLGVSELPAHEHNIATSAGFASDNSPASNLPAMTAGENLYNATDDADSILSASTISATGAGASMPNIMPFLCVNFIIALVGVYPSRT
jgi:microcystin-dependent protein